MTRVYRRGAGVSILALLWAWAATHAASARGDDVRPASGSAYQTVTGDDPEEDRSRWDAIYNTSRYVFGKEPAAFLKEQIEKLPVGRALDLAMGEGRNAVFLAKKGFAVEGVDISEVALRKARKLARETGVQIQAVQADLNDYTIKPESYDVILNIDYLQRNLVPQIKRGLKKGGVVVFENATVEALKLPGGQGTPREFLLKKGELRDLFKDFEILAYRENVDSKSAVASLVARKPRAAIR